MAPKGAIFILQFYCSGNCSPMSSSNCTNARSFPKFWNQCRDQQSSWSDSIKDGSILAPSLISAFRTLLEQIAACIGGCLVFLEGPVEQQKTAPLGATKFEKVNDQLNKV